MVERTKELIKLAKELGIPEDDFFFEEDYQRACDKLCETLRESCNYRKLVRIEFVPDPYDIRQPEKAVCHFKDARATVDIRCDNVWSMYLDILRHLNAIANKEKEWDY